jgi:hypothetical protein
LVKYPTQTNGQDHQKLDTKIVSNTAKEETSTTIDNYNMKNEKNTNASIEISKQTLLKLDIIEKKNSLSDDVAALTCVSSASPSVSSDASSSSTCASSHPSTTNSSTTSSSNETDKYYSATTRSLTTTRTIANDSLIDESKSTGMQPIQSFTNLNHISLPIDIIKQPNEQAQHLASKSFSNISDNQQNNKDNVTKNLLKSSLFRAELVENFEAIKTNEQTISTTTTTTTTKAVTLTDQPSSQEKSETRSNAQIEAKLINNLSPPIQPSNKLNDSSCLNSLFTVNQREKFNKNNCLKIDERGLDERNVFTDAPLDKQAKPILNNNSAFTFQNSLLELSDEDNIIEYDAYASRFYEVNSRKVLLKANINNESLPLVESLQLTNQNEMLDIKQADDEEDANKKLLADTMTKLDSGVFSSKYCVKNSGDDVEAERYTNITYKIKIAESKYERVQQIRELESEEEIKSISSIEGSLKGVSTVEPQSEKDELSSSTPLIHLYPKLGILNYI